MAYTTEQLLAFLDAAIKGLTTTTTLGASVLEPQQFDRFVRVLQHKTVVLQRARLQIMDSNLVDIDRIAFAKRIMGPPPTEGQAKSEGDFVSPDFAQHQLIAADMQGVVGITDKMLRRNPEKKGLMDTILTMMAERAGLDIEEQGIKGDTGSADPFLALNDGWLKLARRNVVEDAFAAYDDVSTPSFSTAVGETELTVWYDDVPITGGTFEIYTTSTSGTLVADEDGDGIIDQVAASGISGTIDYESGKIVLTGLTASTDYFVKYTVDSFDVDATSGVLYPENMFDKMIEVVPKEYFTRPGEWEINVPWKVLKAYRNILKARGTALGDEYQMSGNGRVRVPYEDVWIQYVPNMPTNRAWLTHPDNTIYGVFHEVEVEQEREAKKKRTDVIIDCETDYDYEEREATVVARIT